MKLLLSALAAWALAGAASAQPAPASSLPDPLGAAPVVGAAPADWWTAADPVDERLDPLGGRRAGRGQALIAAPVEAAVYRLWGLMPLQTQVLRRGEAIYELWFRPTDASRQVVVRVVRRGDGRVFLQARAGRGCCAAGVSRRVDIDRELERGTAEPVLKALAAEPLWSAPEQVLVQEEGAVSSVCVDGVSYDLTRAEPRRTTHLRRSCDPAEVGSVAPALRALFELARGYDGRFDAALPGDVTFAKEAREHAALLARGGGLRPRSARSTSAEAPAAAAVVAEAAEDDPRAEILAADRAFAARAGQVGAAQAFREFMDEVDGRLIPTGVDPVVGADAIYALMGGDAPETVRLVWEPVEAWVAESGDFGFSWGRSRYIPVDPEQPEREGRYVTVWRKDAGGRWKGLIDIGNTRPATRPSVASVPAP